MLLLPHSLSVSPPSLSGIINHLTKCWPRRHGSWRWKNVRRIGNRVVHTAITSRRISLTSKTEKEKKNKSPNFSPAPLSHIHPPGCCYQETLSLSLVYTLIIMAFFVSHNSNKKKKRWKKKNPFLQRTRHWVETCTTSIVAGSKERERVPLVCVCCVRRKIKKFAPTIGVMVNHRCFVSFFSSVTTRVRHGGRIIISAWWKVVASKAKQKKMYTRKVVGGGPLMTKGSRSTPIVFPRLFECWAHTHRHHPTEKAFLL